MAARLSGDEFALLVHGGPDETFRAAQLAAVVTTAEPVPLDGGATVTVVASVGYTTSRLGVPARVLLGEADEAMYRAKRGGTGVCRYEPASETQAGRCRDRP